MRHAARPLVALGCAALVLAGCTSTDEPDVAPDGPATAEPTPTGPDPEDVVETRTLVLGGAEIEAGIHPLVRTGDLVVATLDLSVEELPADEDQAAGDVFLGSTFGAVAVPAMPSSSGIRLVDLEQDQVHLVALDAEGATVGARAEGWLTVEPEGTRLQLAFAAPAEDVASLGLFLPGGPYVPAVPVVEGEVPAPDGFGTEDDVEPWDPAEVDQAPVVELESFTRELDGAVATQASTEQVEVVLGSDVLFAVDSADLSATAEAALDTAAAQLASRAPGEVSVVGHTDDVGTDAYNQDLSERRAEAVAQALTERIDTGEYPLEVSGRGESEPVAAGTDDESRALNRRVTLTLVSEVTTTTQVAATGELPPFEDDGPVGAGSEGVEVESMRPWGLRAPEARLVDGHLVVDLEVTALDDGVDATAGVGFLSGVWHPRGTGIAKPQTTAGGVTVLVGDTAVYPLDYLQLVSENGTELWAPLTDVYAVTRLDGGQTRTYSIVYPEIGAPETITLQLESRLGTQSFRLTDVPVVGDEQAPEE